MEHAIDIAGTFALRKIRSPITLDTLDVVDRVLGAVGGEDRHHGVTGFNTDFVDLNGDGRLDIITNEYFQHAVAVFTHARTADSEEVGLPDPSL